MMLMSRFSRIRMPATPKTSVGAPLRSSAPIVCARSSQRAGVWCSAAASALPSSSMPGAIRLIVLRAQRFAIPASTTIRRILSGVLTSQAIVSENVSMPVHAMRLSQNAPDSVQPPGS